MEKDNRYPVVLVGVVTLFLMWSAVRPHNYFTWLLEVLPALITFGILAATYRRFRLSNFTYTLLAIHAIILIIGGHYTYAEVPLFNWLRDMGVFGRNNYDKIGHLAQGFIPVLVAREVLIKKDVVKRGGWLALFSASIVIAASAIYELVEMFISMLSGEAGDSFLGTQGYIWDTQTDMLMCSIGAVLALIIFSRYQDRVLGVQKK